MGLKILFFSHKFYPDVGGIETNAEILAKSFTMAGHEVRLVTWTEAVGLIKFPFGIVRNPSLFQLFRQHRWADIIFENNPCLRLAWPNLFFNLPSVVALNTWISRVDGSMGNVNRLKIFLLKRASKVIAVSNALKDKTWPDAVVIGNPFNNDLFRIIPGEKKMFDFVFLGRLVSDKGADIVIKAMAFFPNAKLTIIGDGPELEALTTLASDLKLSDRVKFTGILTGDILAQTLNKHKYILVPSVWDEPFGSVVLEGMACGCLPIVSNCGGLSDAVGKAGVLFKRGDISSLVASIKMVINDIELENRLRQMAAPHLASHFPKSIAKQYLSIIEGAVI